MEKILKSGTEANQLVADAEISLLSSQAQAMIRQGNDLVLQNRRTEAKQFFQKSIEIFPTADGYTYLAWMLTDEGQYDEAIQLCTKAIELDPGFGNPYNDIGVYLMHQGKSKSAIPWFEKAKTAKRYEPRHFPYINLASIYMAEGRLNRAKDEFEAVLKIMPDQPDALKFMEAIRTIMETASPPEALN